jgi:hypothetical protein
MSDVGHVATWVLPRRANLDLGNDNGQVALPPVAS